MSGQRGFTIIESLVALAILAVMLVSLYAAIGLSFRTFDKAADVQEAVLAAQSQLDAVVAQRVLPAQTRGKINGTAFDWELSVLSSRPAIDGVRLATVRVTVTWPGSARGIAIDRLLLLQAGGGRA